MNLKKSIKVEMIAVLGAAAILFSMLMVRPITGVADNGDFGRIMGSTGLAYLSEDWDDRYFGYVNREYRVVPSGFLAGGYFSTAVLLVKIAKGLDRLFTAVKGIFDIRFLALLYCGIFLTAIYLTLKYGMRLSLPVCLLMAGVMVFILTDAGYISYFNTLYGEPLSFTSLLLAVGAAFVLARQPSPKVWALLTFFGAAVLLTGAKAQNAPVGVFLILFGAGFLRLRKDFRWRGIIFASCFVLLCTILVSYFTIPYETRVCNKYQSVFYGILKDSPSPKEDLEKLGLGEELAVLAGTHFFMEEYPIDIKSPGVMGEVNRNVNPFRVAMFYLSHPGRFIGKLEVAAANGFKLLQGFGNYEKAYGIRYKQTVNKFKGWSDFKLHVLPHSLFFVVLFFGGTLLLLVVLYRRSKKLQGKIPLEALMLVWVIGVVQFIVPIVGDGEADLSKHLFLFNVCFDLLFLFHIFCFLQGTSTIVRKLYQRYK